MSDKTINNKKNSKSQVVHNDSKQAKIRAAAEAKAAKEKAKADAEAARKARESAEKDRREAERQAKIRAAVEARAAKEKAKQDAAEQKTVKAAANDDISPGSMFQGMVKIQVLPPCSPAQVKRLQESLSLVQGLHIVLIGGSASSGNELIVSAGQALNLADILRDVPVVSQVVKKDQKIGIILRPD